MMATNPFDQFDAAPAKAAVNPFDQFDSASAPQSAKKRDWLDVPGEAMSNVGSSAKNLASGLYEAVRHPIDTATNVLDIGAGALRNSLPQSVVDALDSLDNPDANKAAKRASATASAAGQMLKDRYGSEEAIKKTIATDPVGFAADASTLLSGGAALAGKVPALSGVASALDKAAAVVNPLTVPVKIASKAAPYVMPLVDKAAGAAGNVIAAGIGNLGTHTGAETIKQAFKSGREGGESAKAFTDNLRGNVPMTDVLETAKQNIADLGAQKSSAYRQGIAQVSQDKSILDFGGIDKAVQDAYNAVTFKGRVKNTKAAEVQQAISGVIDEWKKLDPAEYHTPEGLDALKQQIGSITEGIPYEQKTATMVGSKIYNSIKDEIVKQAPVYADTMKSYTDATEQIREIERALSLGKNASVDTAMRKLQSLMRNNVNTNYGNRLAMAKALEQQGGREIMPALAGQALSSPTPRGLGGAVASGIGIGGYAAGGLPAAIPALAIQSPRLMGEAAYGTGKLAASLARIKTPQVTPAATLNAAQAGRIEQQKLRDRVARQRALQGISNAKTVDEAISAASGQ